MGIRPIEFWRLLHKLFDSIPDDMLLAQSGVADRLSEELVEVKVVLKQKLEAACVELHYFLVHYLRIRKSIEVEGSDRVALLAVIPLKCCKTDLESIHSQTIVFNLLVRVFNCIKVVALIVKSDAQAGELRVKCDKVCRIDRFANQL